MPVLAERGRDSDIAVVQQLRDLYIVARDQKRSLYDNWLRNYRLMHSRLGGNSTTPSASPPARDSEIYPLLSGLIAWMTDQNPECDYIPAADPNSLSYNLVAQTCSDLAEVMSANYYNLNYGAQVKLALWDACLYGMGVIKTVWDNHIDNNLGNAVIRRIDPYSFFPDPRATSFEDAEFFVEARELSYDQIERMYPNASFLLGATGGDMDDIDKAPTRLLESGRMPKAMPGNIPQSGTWPSWGSSTPGRWGTPRDAKQDKKPLPLMKVYEFWLRQNEKSFDDYDDLPEEDRPDMSDKYIHDSWRCVVLCRNQILMDELAEDLWPYASHPYERYVFEDVGELYGVALVDHLASPQVFINRLLQAAEQNAELTGNPILIEAENAGTARMGITNKPGTRIPVRGAAGMANSPKWLEPPQMSSAIMDLIKFWIDRMENISGLSSLQKGQAPNQRNASDVINQVQDAAFVRIRSYLTNLETTMRAVLAKATELVIDNYDQPRFMAITGPDGQMSSKALAEFHFMVPSDDGKQIPLKYAIRVSAGSTRPTSRQARMAEANTLFNMGVVDDQYVLETHQVRNISTLLQRLYMKRQQGLMASGGPGQRQRAGRAS